MVRKRSLYVGRLDSRTTITDIVEFVKALNVVRVEISKLSDYNAQASSFKIIVKEEDLSKLNRTEARPKDVDVRNYGRNRNQSNEAVAYTGEIGQTEIEGSLTHGTQEITLSRVTAVWVNGTFEQPKQKEKNYHQNSQLQLQRS